MHACGRPRDLKYAPLAVTVTPPSTPRFARAQASFRNADSKTVVIATVSPASKDTEHSLNTLRHACVMGGQVR